MLQVFWQAWSQSLRLPVWFNLSAPRIRDGLLDHERVTETEALVLMLADPLLIRRPLMDVDGDCRVGFDSAAVDAWIGLGRTGTGVDLETCPRGHAALPCKVAP